mgnify:CR=1 FL=1
MQFDFKEKAKKRQDRNSPIKPFFVYNLKIHPKFHGVNSKFLWGLFSPHGVPLFLTAPTKVWLPRKTRFTIYLDNASSPSLLILSRSDKRICIGYTSVRHFIAVCKCCILYYTTFENIKQGFSIGLQGFARCFFALQSLAPRWFLGHLCIFAAKKLRKAYALRSAFFDLRV